MTTKGNIIAKLELFQSEEDMISKLPFWLLEELPFYVEIRDNRTLFNSHGPVIS